MGRTIDNKAEQSTGTTSSTVGGNNSSSITNYVYEERSRPWWVWTLVLAPCLLPVVWEYHVTVTSNELSFGYCSGCMKKCVNRSDIVSVEVIEHINGLMEWGGYGIRKKLPSWDTGYIARNGPGVRMVLKENGKELCYTFSCRDPNDVVDILTAKKCF